MKLLREVPKQTVSPTRPVYPIEAKLDALRKRHRELVNLIIESEATDKSVTYTDDDARVERDARALVQSEAQAEPKKPRAGSQNLKAFLHERAVIERAMEIGNEMLTDLRAAWAQQIMAQRMKEYRASVRDVALAIETLKRADSKMQGLLKLFGAAGRNSGLPCASVNVAAGLNQLKTFTTAAQSAGLISKEDI
jgi:hypothetical protein